VLDVTIRPPFGPRANAPTSRSISRGSRTSIGVNSTPDDDATDWIAANWPPPMISQLMTAPAAGSPRSGLSHSDFVL
jgi:hypothetical protein